MTTISGECRHVARLLRSQAKKLVLAESCTCGMVAATLGRVPGISASLCGSLVTYRCETKTAWLNIPSAILDESGDVSEGVARRMAEGALELTPESELAVSITGHLGPDAPSPLDGVIFIGIARRKPDKIMCDVTKFHLTKDTRIARQREATLLVLSSLRQVLLGAW